MFQCNICLKSFSTQHGLKGHKRVHNELNGSYFTNRSKRTLPTFTCFECGITKKFDPNKTDGKFCSNKCQAEHIWKTISIPKILNGEGTKHLLKRYLIETFGNKCSICGIFEWNNKPLVFQIDHIDGNPNNNNIENGRILCPNCHSQTDTFSIGHTRKK